MTFLLFLACSGGGGGHDDQDDVPADDSGTPADDSGDDTGTTIPAVTVTIYVDAANATDKEPDGTTEHPFPDLVTAFDAVQKAIGTSPKPAIVVEVATGTYDDSALLDASGTKNAPILIHGSEKARPVVTGLGTASTALFLMGDYIVVENIEVSDTKTAGLALKGNHITVRSSVLHDIGCCGRGLGIAFVDDGTTGILIEKSTFYNTGLRAIEADGVVDSVFRDNIFFDSGSPIVDEAAFIELTDATNVLVENNYFRDDAGKINHGILVQGGSGLVLRRNLLVDLAESAIHVDGSDGTTVVQNTMVAFDDRGRTTALLALDGNPSGLVATGNLLVQRDEGPLVSIGSDPTGAADWVDGNAFSKGKSPAGDWFTLWDGTALADLAGWTKETGFDTTSLSADPMIGAWDRADPIEFAPDAKSPILDTYPGPTEVTVAGTGTVVHVAHASMFSAGLGLAPADVVVIAGKPVEVAAVDAKANTITLTGSATFVVGDRVAFPSSGKGPDYGAVEAGLDTEIGTAAASALAFD